MAALAITVPAKKVSAWVAETTVNGTRDWMASLPIADSSESAKELYRALYTLNRMELAPKARLELMELYRTPVARVTDQLHGRLVHALFPLSERRLQLAEFIGDLQAEMAYGYKTVLLDLEKTRKPGWRKGGMRLLAAQRAMHYLGTTVLRAAVAYLPFPPGVWRDAHSLYEYAEKAGCLDEPLKPTDPESDTSHLTLARRYKEILLLALAGPYQMPVGQCQQAAGFLHRWADLVTIGQGSEATPDGYVIDSGRDQPAIPVWRYTRDADRDHTQAGRHSLQLQPLIDHVASLLRQIDTGRSPRSLDLGTDCLDDACVDLLRRLERNWKGGAKRQASRLPMDGIVTVCLGLNTIHYHANGRKGFSVDAAIGQPNAGEEMEHAYSDTELRFALDDSAKPANDIRSHLPIFRLSQWEMVNASTGGALLTSASENELKLRIGDLVGILDQNTKGDIRVFVVRRLVDKHRKRSMQIGLEMLASGVTPIVMRAERGGRPYQPCLKSPAQTINGRKLPPTLLLPRGVRGRQQDIELIESQQAQSTSWVRILDVLEQTGGYEHVVYAPLDTRED